MIDPTLSYASYLGGSAEDEAFGIAVDGSGNAYVTGQTKSPVFGGKTAGPNFDVFVTEVNTAGSALVFTDIFSATGTGSGDCSGNAIALDTAGAAAFVGGSATVGFPTLNAFQPTFGGGTGAVQLDGFVMKVAASTGALTYSTYLGGSDNDIVNAVAVDGATPANTYVAGQTASTNFPGASSSTIQSTNAGSEDAFVTKLDGTGALTYSTYLGGSSNDLATGVALDSSGNAYMTGITISSNFPTTSSVFQKTSGGGDDSFVAEVKSDGSTLLYSTLLGGSGNDDALGIAVDGTGDAYIAGSTNSSNFPTANAIQAALGGASATNVFVTKLNAGATALMFSTYYGGSLDDAATGIALDPLGDAFVTGRTTSSTFPVSNSFQQSLSGTSDAFVTEFSNSGFVVFSSFLGGTGTENGLQGSDAQSAVGAIAVDKNSNAYVAGVTNSTSGFPVVGGFQSNYAGGLSDSFVAKVVAASPDFSVAVSPTSISTTSGQTTSTITVTVSSVNSSYGQSVNLSCGGLPSKAVCHFSPASVMPGTSPQTSSLTIATNGASSARLALPSTNHRTQVFAALFLPMFGITLIGAGKNQRKKRLFGFLMLGLVLAGLMILPACGGGNGGGGGGGGGGTTPGTYNISVAGAGGGVNHSAALTLTVN